MVFLLLYFVGMAIFAVVVTRNSEGGLNALRELWAQDKLARVIMITALLGWPGFTFGYYVINHDSGLANELQEIIDGIF